MNSFTRKQAPTAPSQKGKLMLLVVLVVTGVVIAVVQLVGRSAAAAPADESAVIKPVRSDAAGGRLHREPVDLTVHWPVEIQQDLFEQERIIRVATAVSEKPDAIAIAAHARQLLRLQAIMFDDQPRALINGQLCRPGSTIHGYVLQAISARQVILIRQGVSVPLGL